MDLKSVMAGISPKEQTGQNLINPSKLDTSNRSPGFWRSLCLDIVSILSAGGFGYAYYRYLTQGSSVWILFAMLMFFGVVSVIQVFLAKRNIRRLVVIFLEVVALLGWFWQDNLQIIGITGLVMLVLLAWGYFSGHERLQNSVEIPFFGASGNVLGKFTTAALLFMILIYVPQIGGNALVVSQQSFRTFFDWTSGLVNGFYPELSLNGSFGTFAQSFSKMELQNNPSFQTLNTAQQNAAIQQGATQFSQNFLQSSAVPVASSSPASDAFYNVLNGVLNAWQSQSSGWFDVGWATVLFIGLRTVGILFVWLAQFVSLIFYEILLASGFMKVSEENRTRELIGY
jgi:hypothetical protein